MEASQNGAGDSDTSRRTGWLATGLRRSVAKAVSWRIVGSIDTFLLSFFVIRHSPFTGEDALFADTSAVVEAAAYIAIMEVVTKLVLFVGHEQLWQRIGWGIETSREGISELRRRSAVKSLVWRVIAFLDTTLLAFIFTGSAGAALAIGALEILTKIFLYFLHERLWLKI